MIIRTLGYSIQNAIASFPSVTILGPRQSGKTTLAKEIFNDYAYINLENPDQRRIVQEDPRSIFSKNRNLIIDEAQHVPELFSYIQTYLDTGNYKIVITGSNQFDLNAKISQSLAGRTAIFKLLPLSLKELAKEKIEFDADKQIYTGFYPAIYDRKQDPTLTYRSYYETYLQKDVRQITNILNVSLFDRFIRVCAGRVGNVLNYSSLSNEIGVAVNTIRAWISVLETSFVCYTLKPYSGNIGKRMIKSPKLYFYDVGLATYLLGIEDPSQVNRDPLRGALFENMIISEFLKERFNQGKDLNGYFYRDSHGTEIDYLKKEREGVHGFEIKSASTYQSNFKKSLVKVSQQEGIQMLDKTVLFNGLSIQGPEGVQIRNYMEYFKG